MDFDICEDCSEESTENRRINRQRDEQPTNGIACLPQEVALDIISRLPMMSLIQFRFVCKAWEKLSYNPNLVSLHLSEALKINPYLMFHCDFPIKNLLYFVELPDDLYGDKNKVRKFEIPFSDRMPEFNVVGSCNGLLCLVNSLMEDAIYIYNPFTGNYKELPKPTTIYQDPWIMYGFGFHPMTMEYKVIKIAYYRNTLNMNTTPLPSWTARYPHQYFQSDVQIFCLRSKRWRSIGRVPYQLDRRCSVVLLNGRFHWTKNIGHYNGQYGQLIVSFDLSDELFREVPSPELDPRVFRRDCHLATLGECLCIAIPVFGTGGSLDIWVMKEYNVKESWVKEYNIGVFCPNPISQDLKTSHGIWWSFFDRRMVNVLCLLKNGEILLEHRGGTLASYNPETGLFNVITFPKMPKLSQTVLHIGSLSWINAS